MSHGTRLYDQTGSISLEVTDRLTRLYGIYYVTSSAVYTIASLSVPGLSPNTHFCFAGNTPAWITTNNINIFNNVNTNAVIEVTVFII